MKRKLPAKDLKIFKEKLLNLKEDLVVQIKDLSENTLMKSQKEISGDLSAHTLHLADVATNSYERDFNLSLVSNERNVLFEIDEALKRIEEKKYGFCSVCSKPIRKKRLKAIPYAKYCTKCKEKLEKESGRAS